MKTKIATHLTRLNSISIGSSFRIFRDSFNFLSFSLTKLTIEQLDNWIKLLGNPTLNDLWVTQKEMKHPSFILFFAMREFRNRTLQDKKYFRELSVRSITLNEKNAQVIDIMNKINRDIDQLSAFDGVIFLGNLIGAWMLTCPKAIVLSGLDKTQNWQPNQFWLRSIYPETLGKDISSDELEILYILDYHLYYTFEDMEAHNTE